MPRKAREKSSTGIYHIMLRGVNRQTIFENHKDKLKFLTTLKKYKIKSGFKLYAYCLMDNHVHLLIEEVEETISQFMKRISSSYVYYYNVKYERSGHLFQERFKSEPVEDIRYFMTVLRYIHQNPLKAGLADDVFKSSWTSIEEYMSKADLVDTEKVLLLFSMDKAIAMNLFIKYMSEVNEDQCLDEVNKVKLHDNDVREYLSDIGIENVSVLQQMEKEPRDKILAMLKQLNGVTLSQLTRITGFSKSIIQRAR